MSLNDLYNLLNNAIHDNQINLSAELTPDLAVVLQALDVPLLLVNQPRLSQSLSAVTLEGSTSYRNNNCSATLVGTLSGPNYAFTLKLAVESADVWTFRSVFDNIPDTYTLQGITLQPSDSFLYETQITQPVFIASNPPPPATQNSASASNLPAIQFTGLLNMTGPLAPYADYLGNGPFPLQGTILILHPNFPLFQLRAVVAGKSIDITNNFNTVNNSNTANNSIGQIAIRLRTGTYPETASTNVDVSTLELAGSVDIGSTTPVVLEVAAQLLQGDIRWILQGDFDDYTEQLQGGLEQLASFLNVPLVNLLAPPAVKALSSFYLKDIRVSLIPPNSAQLLPQLDSLSGTVMTHDDWIPPIPFVKVSRVGARWLVNFSDTSPVVSGCVFGTVTFGKSPNEVPFFINASIPDFRLQCSLNTGYEFDLGQVLGWFYGGTGPSTGLRVTDLNFVADPVNQSFQFQAGATTTYAITFGNLTFTLADVGMWFYSLKNEVSGGITGTMLIDGLQTSADTLNQPGFWLAANYADSSWQFEGGLIPGTTLELVNFVSQFLGLGTPPACLPTLTIENLLTSFDTGSGTYVLSGSIVGRWKLNGILGGLDLSIRASADITRHLKENAGDAALLTAGSDMVLEGSLSGKFQVNQFFVGLGMNLKEEESTYVFSVGYGNLVLTGTTAWTGDEDHRHQIIQFTLQGVTLGGILEYFVNLAYPNNTFHLDSPWDFLNKIDLSRFTLTVDPTDSTVSFIYAIEMDLVFIQIKTVGVKYVKMDGQGSVQLVLTGRFLDEEYKEGNELAWDVVNDPPPAVPGAGEELLKLRYLGLGQHIALQNAASFDSVSDVIKALRDQMKPIADTSKNPLDQPSGSLLLFDENSHWLVGLDMTVLDALSLGVVFNDPNIYGLVVTMAGPQAGTLAGLKFEVLYKRITSDIGVFKAVFRMPEAFRQFQFGVVSLTLGVVSVEIYTNGDFKVDLGFPKNRDFSDSFCLQAYIFIGHGGLYFGKLSGPTSSRVPVITNGTFNPVLELGVGLAVGVGREFRYGPLSAGLYVEMVVIFEGALAWFHPSDSSQSVAMYYWAQGVAGIIGKLYGNVDFKVIKVSVSVEAYAMVTLVLESHEPTVVLLDVGVEVKASIKILFIKVHFSFGLHLHESFTIGEHTMSPWILAADQQGRANSPVRQRLTRIRRRTPQETRAFTRLAAAKMPVGHTALFAARRLCSDGYRLNWGNSPVFPDGKPHAVTLKLIPAFSVSNIQVQLSNSEETVAPSYQILFLLFADNGVDPTALELEDLRAVSTSRSTTAADASQLALNVLIEAMFRWALSAAQIDSGKPVSGDQLEDLYQQMNLPETSDIGFAFDNLSQFFDNNLEFHISSIPEGETPDDISATAFPMPPTLAWQSEQLGGIDYSTYQPIGATYEEGIRQYFQKILVQPSAESSAVQGAEEENTESMASFLFRDYFLMIARNVVQSALDLLETFSWELSATDSLQTIATSEKFPRVSGIPYVIRENDTVASVASVFGVSTAEMLFLNPTLASQLAGPAGSSISLELGLTPQAIAITNQTAPLTSGVQLGLDTVTYSLGASETLLGIARRFGLAQATDLLNRLPAGFTSTADNTRLLQTGGTVQITDYTYSNALGLDIDLVSAVFYTRLNGAKEITYQAWYAETIFQLNQGTLQNHGDVLPAGITLQIPAALYDPVHTLANPYITLAGDTLDWIGAYFSLVQNFNADKDPEGVFGIFNQSVRTLNPGNSGAVVMPTMIHVMEAMETLSTLWQRLFLTSINDLVTRIQEQPGLLAALSVITVPNVQYTTADGDTLAKVAAKFNLSVEDLVSRPQVAAAVGLFCYDANQKKTLTIRDVPQMNVNDFLECLQTGDAHSQINGMMSRFFLHGLRLPAPEQAAPGNPITATGPMTSLYSLNGQQVKGVAPDPASLPETVRVVVNFTESIATKWVIFENSTTIGSQETLEALEARHPLLRSRNPGLSERFRPGLIALTSAISKDNADGLEISITEQDLDANYPALTLSPTVVVPLSAMPLSETTPRSYGFQQQIAWQSPTSLSLPGPLSGSPLAGHPTLWPFPSDLTTQIQTSGTDFSAYSLMYTQGDDPSTLPTEAGQYAWGTLVKISIRRVRKDKENSIYLPNCFEVKGADQTGRSLLYSLIQSLPVQDVSADQIFLLYSSDTAGADPTGLSSGQPDSANTYLIKTNLTTETASGVQLRTLLASGQEPAPVQGEYFADLSCHRQFLLLLWECSVVGGGGFYLNYTDTDGNSLPESLFGQDGSGALWLVFLNNAQNSQTQPDRKLYSYNNCAILSCNLDPSSANLFAEVSDGSQVTLMPTVQPGNVGFELVLKNPEMVPPADPKQLTAQRLYSLLGYKLLAQAGGSILGSNEAPPVGPVESGDPSESAFARAIRRRKRSAGLRNGTELDNWLLQQVIPVSRYATSYPLPDCESLPDPQSDPYAGIARGASALVSVWFTDVYGNVSVADSASGNVTSPIPLPIGYTDNVIGIGKWPNAVTAYTVQKPSNIGDGANLRIQVDFQPGSVLPSMYQSLADLGATLEKQLSRYNGIYYQIWQADTTFHVLTSLSELPGQEPDVLEVDGVPLRAFACAANLWLQGVRKLADASPDTAQHTTLQMISAFYGVNYAELAAYNKNQQIHTIFSGTTLSTPQFLLFSEGDSAQSLCARIPSDVDSLTPQALLLEPENQTLPLRVGIDLATPARTITLPQVPGTLAEVAKVCNCLPRSLAAANINKRGLLTQGALLSYQGITLSIGLSSEGTTLSFEDMAGKFIHNYTPSGMENGTDSRTTGFDIAMANQDMPGIFQSQAVLTINDYVVVSGETLAQNGSGASAQTLAELNTALVNIFDSGAPVYYAAQDFSMAEMSLEEFCTTYGITAEQALYHNCATTLSTPTALHLPGAVSLPETSAGLTVPYTLQAADSLQNVAARFDVFGSDLAHQMQNLAQLNLNLPYVLASGKTISVDGASVQTQRGDSFQRVLDRFSTAGHSIQLLQLTNAIGTTPGFFTPGALLVCPPATTSSGNDPVSLDTLAQRFGLSPVTLASANCALLGIIQEGISLSITVTSCQDGQKVSQMYSVTTVAGDTLNSVVSRFSGQVPTSLEDLVAANSETPFILPGKDILLPPASAVVSVVIGSTGNHYPAAIFPVVVKLSIQRSAELVHPDFKNNAPTQYDRSLIPPYATKGKNSDDPLRLEAFARELQSAIPALWLATCKPGSALEGEVSSAPSVNQDLWAIDFSAGGISQVQVKPGVNISGNLYPRFFALRPLSNTLSSELGVGICPLNDDGTLGTPVPTDFQQIDLEVWARKFLADVELFLSAAYSSPIWRLNGGVQRLSLNSIIAAKKTLAEAIVQGLARVLDTSDASGAAALDSAQEELQQELLYDLSRAYATAVLLQYDASVASSGLSQPARLSGQAEVIPANQQNGTGNNGRNLSLRNAKTALTSGNSFVNFLLEVNNEKLLQCIPLNLNYVFQELEFHVQDVSEVVQGYQSSSWLSLIVPIGGADKPSGFDVELGSSPVPLPLRMYPENPRLVSQSAQAVKGENHPPQSIAEAELWKYQFTYEHQDAAQDALQLVVRINEGGLSSTRLAVNVGGPTLLGALAQYMSVSDKLWSLLKKLPDLSTTGADAILGNAVETLAALIENVALAWRNHWGASLQNLRAASPTVQVYPYSAKLNPDSAGTFIESLTLGYSTTAPWPGTDKPAITCIFGENEILLTPGTPVDGTCVYTFPEGADVPMYSRLQFSIEFTGLNIVEQQNALSLASVSRNVAIFQDAAYSTLAPTNPAFVFQTPQVGFASVTTPLLSWEKQFPFGSVGEDLASAIQAVLMEVLGSTATQQQLALSVQYGYTLVPSSDGSDPIVMRMPVLFKPRFQYQSSVCTELATALSDWIVQKKPNTQNGYWNFAVDLFSGIPGAPQVPLLALKQLTTGIR